MADIERVNEFHGDLRLKIKINEIIDVLNRLDPGAEGAVMQPAEHQNDSEAVNTREGVNDFNALLAKLQAAGLML